jgi:hypothetical protein
MLNIKLGLSNNFNSNLRLSISYQNLLALRFIGFLGAKYEDFSTSVIKLRQEKVDS